MVTAMHSTRHSLRHEAKPVARTTVTPAQSESESRWKLVQLLHSTLDLEQILAFFYRELNLQLPIASLRYRHRSYELDTAVGTHCAHRCDYNLNTGGEDLGNIQFSRSKRFTEAEFETIEHALSSLVMPLRNALQYRSALETALRDPLTGLNNRISLDSTLEREIQLAERHKQALSMLVIDIDLFKSINDTLGHSAGDVVLRQIAHVIQDTLRNSDVAYRYGGEEFVGLLSNTTEAGALIIAERIRKDIEQSTFDFGATEIHATVSIGVATLIEGDKADCLFNRSDKALYQAKNSGRNRVVCASGMDTAANER